MAESEYRQCIEKLHEDIRKKLRFAKYPHKNFHHVRAYTDVLDAIDELIEIHDKDGRNRN